MFPELINKDKICPFYFNVTEPFDLLRFFDSIQTVLTCLVCAIIITNESSTPLAVSLGLFRPNVKKYCEGNIHPDVRKTYERSPVVITSDVESFFLSCFKEDETENLKKQRHTAKRIYDRLVDEHEFIGLYSAVRDAVRKLRAEPAKQ